MSFSQFVIRNTLRNKRLYMAYFLSTLFAVMVFFTFTGFAFHPELSGGLNDSAQKGMLAAAIIIYGFSFFFVLYSMDVFIQSRKKEFGLLMIQGMSPRQLKRMIFIENLVIGFFATLIGSIAGIGFSQLILMISNQLLHVSLDFYFPVKALLITIASFSLLFSLIAFFIQFRLPKLSLQTLLKAGDLGKGTIKGSFVKGLLAVLLIGAGYGIALLVPGQMVPIVMIPVILVVVVGTRFLFNQLSVWSIEKLKGNQRIFWKKTNMIVFSDLSFRMKDNARSFFLVSIISTVAFAAIGTLYSFQQMVLSSTNSMPYEFQLTGEEAEIADTNQVFTELLQQKGIQADRSEYRVYMDQNQVSYILESEYNQLAKLTDEPTIETNGQAILLKYSEAVGMGNTNNSLTEVQMWDQQILPVSRTQEERIIPAFYTTVVVPDGVNTEGMATTQTIVWQPKGVSREELLSLGATQEDNHLFTAKTYSAQSIIDSFKPILFVGVFIGIVFFVSAGSFLYFRLYSDMDVDVEKFTMIYKMGLSKKELKRMINQQVGILFFTPIVVSLLHGGVALTAMYHMFDQGLQLAGIQVLAAFVVIQVVYYLVARIFYFNKVYKLVRA